jgi:signal transduction histidine kinase
VKATLFFLLFLYGIIYYVNFLNKESRVNEELKASIDELKLNYEIDIFHKTKEADAVYRVFEDDGYIGEILRLATQEDAQKREKLKTLLYTKLKNDFTHMKERGINLVVFTLRDGTVFLRLHAVDKDGDNIKDIRYSIEKTSKDSSISRGLEGGKTFYAFRNVYPLYSEDKEFVGSVDIGFSSKSLQQNLDELNKLHTHFLIRKDALEELVWKSDSLRGEYIESVEHEDFLYHLPSKEHLGVLDKKREDIIEEYRGFIDRNIERSKAFSFYAEDDNGIMVVSFLPIRNIKKDRTIAYLVSYDYNQNIPTILMNFYIVNIASLVVLLLIFYFLKKEADHKKELERRVKEAIEENTKHLEMLQQQSKLAQMGEMMGAIAHQWRQPLNALALNIQELPYIHEDGELDKKFLDGFVNKSMNILNFMSKTIDDFRNFFKKDKESKAFSVIDAINDTLSIQSAQLKSHHISVQIEGESFEVLGYKNEFQQVILNLISNAKDALLESNTKEPQILVKLDSEQKLILIEDNAGGIPSDIIDRVFEPYFSTKEQGKGIGIGLYMSKIIIEHNMKGTLRVTNTKSGARFIIAFEK